MTDLHFAPAPKLIEPRGWAVPADVQRISARLTFDVRKQEASGKATVDFCTGERAGFAIFDLRQPIESAKLDGTPVSPALLAHHRFGIKREQALRVVRRRLEPGGSHRLSMDYRIEMPPIKASGAGGYQPALEFGPEAVNFNFGFTDLGGGRYLEAWVPANLIYDRFSLTLEVRVRGAAGTPHVLITNGEARELERNHWKVNYPASFTALSPLLQLHPQKSIESGECAVRLPVSGRRLKIEAHQFRDSAIQLSEQLEKIAGWLCRNETEIGPYHHGDRFVAFLHRGGMEYDGACTAEPDALEHEVFHSWWARGLKPASQNDGWIDEAWTSFHDDHTPDRRVFDFREKAECLSPRSPWNRATPRASYRQGSRFFEGLAAHVGLDEVREIMRDIYRLHAPGLITTAQLEAHFLDRTGEDPLVQRAFEHWVWGGERSRR